MRKSETTEEKDLGVITTADLNISRQCYEATSNANIESWVWLT